jgi:3-hydroxybutyryl-CoA dehydrogenase
MAAARPSIVAVIGPGMMGRGIATCCIAGGPHEVRLYGRRVEALDEASAKIQELHLFLKQNGMAAATPGRLVTTTSLQEAVEGADFIFESIAEDMDAKKALFAELALLSEGILCTNTSSLSVTALAEGCGKDSHRFMAAHFIGPAHLVPLVELCPAAQTQGNIVQRVRSFLESIGKRPVVMIKEIEGFIAARLQAALYRECLHLKLTGAADCETIDAAVRDGFGRRLNQIGPFQQADFAGVDLVQNTHAKLFPQLGSYQRDILADELVKEGRLGAKTLAGHHNWTAERRDEVMAWRDAELLRRLKADAKL